MVDGLARLRWSFVSIMVVVIPGFSHRQVVEFVTDQIRVVRSKVSHAWSDPLEFVIVVVLQ